MTYSINFQPVGVIIIYMCMYSDLPHPRPFIYAYNGERNLKNGGAVKGAVIQLMKENNIQNLITTNEGFWISYYFLKSC